MANKDTHDARTPLHNTSDRPDSPGQNGLERVIIECGAVLRGHFRLASGRHSDVYVEKFRILERPEVLERVCRPLVEHFRPMAPSVIVGPSTGGIIVAYEIARQMGVHAVYVEAVDGKRLLKRGGLIEPDARVLLVDDVLTTGVSLREVLSVIETTRAEVVGIAVLIDRAETELDFGYELVRACRFEARSYAEAEVPEWLAAVPVSTPGTRANLSAISGS